MLLFRMDLILYGFDEGKWLWILLWLWFGLRFYVEFYSCVICFIVDMLLFSNVVVILMCSWLVIMCDGISDVVVNSWEWLMIL